MANQKRNHYYVLVMGNDGPSFVTEMHYGSKMAYWKKSEKPLEMSKSEAESLTLGLNLNFHLAFTIMHPVEIETQPYLYELGKWEWVKKDKE